MHGRNGEKIVTDEIRQIGGRGVLVCDPEGAVLGSEAAAVDLIGSTWGLDVDWVAVPVERLSPDFLTLRTGVAGGAIQKFVTYGLRLAIVGDIGDAVAGSSALADFVRESNGGDRVWFVPDLDALSARLEGRP